MRDRITGGGYIPRSATRARWTLRRVEREKLAWRKVNVSVLPVELHARSIRRGRRQCAWKRSARARRQWSFELGRSRHGGLAKCAFSWKRRPSFDYSDHLVLAAQQRITYQHPA